MKKAEQGHENHERWMVSYADFLTLLFAVFVVLYSFAMSKQSEAQSMIQGLIQSFNETGLISSSPGVIALPGPVAQSAASQAIQAAQSSEETVSAPVEGGGGVMNFGMTSPMQEMNDTSSSDSDSDATPDESSATSGNLVASEVVDPTSGYQIKDFNTQELPDIASGQQGSSAGDDNALDDGGQGPTEAQTQGESPYGYPFDTIKESISDAIAKSSAQDHVILEDDGRWLTINIDSSLLFAQGSASVLNSSLPVIHEISVALSSINNYIRVRGYTDNVFDDTGVYASNWELSAARAISVLNELIKNGIEPSRLAVEGYGQYSPFYSNSTRAGRAQNRRVVIAVSRFAVEGRALDVIQGESEQIAPTPKAFKEAGTGNIELMRNEQGVIELNFGQ